MNGGINAKCTQEAKNPGDVRLFWKVLYHQIKLPNKISPTRKENQMSVSLREQIIDNILKVAMAHHDDISQDDEYMASISADSILSLIGKCGNNVYKQALIDIGNRVGCPDGGYNSMVILLELNQKMRQDISDIVQQALATPTFSGEKENHITIKWGKEGIGFGQFVFTQKGENLHIDNEYMGKKFIKEMMNEAIDNAILENPDPTKQKEYCKCKIPCRGDNSAAGWNGNCLVCGKPIPAEKKEEAKECKHEWNFCGTGGNQTSINKINATPTFSGENEPKKEIEELETPSQEIRNHMLNTKPDIIKMWDKINEIINLINREKGR